MSAAASYTSRGAFTSLWARAGLWRFSFLSACLLTLIFLLFPPEKHTEALVRGTSLAEQATYIAQSTATGVAVSQTTPSEANRQAGDPVIAQEAHPQTGRYAPILGKQLPQSPNTSAPRSAQIALASPDSSHVSQNVSGVDAALMGRTYSGSISVNGYGLPLPAGQWAMLANSTVSTPTASGMTYFLGRIEHKRLVGAVRVLALKSTERPGAGFSALAGCKEDEPSNNHLALESLTPFDHQACWLIRNYYTPPWQQWADRAIKFASIDRAAAGDMAAKGVVYAQDFVNVRFSRAEKWGLLEVAYLFNPEAEGISSRNAVSFRDSDWYPGNVSRYPDKVAYIDKLKTWGTSFWPKFKTAFDDATPPMSPASPAEVKKFEREKPIATDGVISGVQPFNIKMGDSVATVKAILKTELDPQPLERNPTLPPNTPDINAGKSVLHLATKGVWVFFDQSGKVYTIRLDAPFTGDVRGVRLGDDLAKLTSTLGSPLTKPYPAFGRMQAYRYVVDDSRYVVYDIDDNKVQYMFITK